MTHPKIYVSINPDNNLDVERQIFKETVSQLFKIPIIAACSKDHESCSNLPIKNCNDSVLNQVLVIKLEPGNNQIQEDPSCIAVLGNRDYIIKIIEELR